MLLAGVNDLDWLREYSGSEWFYLVITVVAVLDSVLPVVPSETMVIVGGVSAGLHDLFWPLVIAAGAGGAFAGDLLSYTIGRVASDRLQRRFNRTEKGRRRLAWAEEQIAERGGILLITGRFIPGGRTVLTLTCGITRQPRPWFVKWAVIAATNWAGYATMLGFIGGRTFEDNHLKAFGVAFGIAIGATATVEAVRYLRHRRAARAD